LTGRAGLSGMVIELLKETNAMKSKAEQDVFIYRFGGPLIQNYFL
jgi:hypothetical protein